MQLRDLVRRRAGRVYEIEDMGLARLTVYYPEGELYITVSDKSAKLDPLKTFLALAAELDELLADRSSRVKAACAGLELVAALLDDPLAAKARDLAREVCSQVPPEEVHPPPEAWKEAWR
jgi:hypothetical protein